MHVVFDSSAIWLGRPLTGTNARYLSAYLEHADAELHVPEVVVRETETLIREHVSAEHKKLAKSVEQIRKQGVRLYFRPSDPQTMAETAVRMFDRRLKNLQIDRLDIPDTGGHGEVLQRLQSGKRPFRGTPERDVGYRDYLIWKTVLSLAGSDDSDVAFVTSNVKDFGEGRDEGWRLHSELLAESRDVGLDVKLYTSVEQFVTDVVKPALPVAARVQALLSSAKQQRRLRKWIEDHLSDEGYGHVIDDLMEWKGIQIETVSIAGASEVGDVTIVEARELDSSTVVADVEATMELPVDFFVYKADAALLDDEDFRGLSDWNEHYYWGETEMSARLELEITLSVAGDEVELQSVDISSVTIDEP